MTEFTLSGMGLLYSFLALSLAIILLIYSLKFWYRNLSERKQEFSNPDKHLPKGLKSRNKYQELDVFANTRPIWMFGLGTALLLTLFAFSWEQIDAKVYIPDNAGFIEEEIEMKRTSPPKPPKPPPPPPPVEIVVVPDELIVDEPVFESMEVDETTVMEEYEPLVDASPAPPPPPPPPVENDVDEIFVRTEVMPRFPGCEDMEGTNAEKDKCAQEKMLQFIYAKVKYPAIARENGIEGRVTLQFVINKSGDITDLNIVRDVAGGCGQAAAIVVEDMPKWSPGMQGGKKVKVRYTLPIVFKLMD